MRLIVYWVQLIMYFIYKPQLIQAATIIRRRCIPLAEYQAKKVATTNEASSSTEPANVPLPERQAGLARVNNFDDSDASIAEESDW